MVVNIPSARWETADRPGDYRPDVDGLRGIAVLAVVAYHAGMESIASGGYVGVDVFFVVSGFLITRLLADEYRQSSSLDFAAFYARRARRLLPALYVLIASVVAASFFVLTPVDGGPQSVARSALAALAFQANHWFLTHTGGYFDEPAHNLPLLHVWSLSLEEQFYLVWPPLLLLALRGWQGRFAREIVALTGLLSGLLCAWLSTGWRASAFYMMAPRGWELSVGALLALSLPLASRHGEISKVRGSMGGALGLAGLASIFIAICGSTAETPYPGLATLLPVAGTAAVIMGNALAPGSLVRRLLSLKPLVGVGLVSYSLYLWHWPLLVLGRAGGVDEFDAPLSSLALFGLSLGIAWLSYRYVEKPGRSSALMLSLSSGQVLRLAAFTGAAVALAAGVLGFWARRSLVTDAFRAELFRYHRDTPNKMQECHLDARRPGFDMPAPGCLEGPGRGEVVAVWGDSHALAWVPFAKRLAESRDAALARFTRDSCPPALGFLPTPGEGGSDCTLFNERVWAQLKTARVGGRAVSAVVLSARWGSYFALPYSSRDLLSRRRSPPNARTRESLQQSLAVTLSGLHSAGLAVYVVGSLPELRSEAWRCILRGKEDYCAMPRRVYEERRAPVTALLEAARGVLPRVHIVDPTEFFCDSETCPVRRNGLVLYWDDDHVSATASRAFFDFAQERGMLPP